MLRSSRLVSLFIAVFFCFSLGKNGYCDAPSTHSKCKRPKACAFNAPSCIATNRQLYFTGNFTYWSASEENLELGIVSNTSNSLFSVDGTVVRQDFDFAPGFQVGMGGNLGRDNWDLFAQYTWFRNTDTATSSLSGSNILIPLRAKPDAASPTFFFGQERWRLAMDLIDVQLSRGYFVGSYLTFRPFFGTRAAFIRQNLDVDYARETTGALIGDSLSVDQKIQSWGVGPLVGLSSNWLVGKGVRLYCNGLGDLLFTQYTKVNWRETLTTSSGSIPTGGISRIEETDLNYLRLHLSLELGFGWGNYSSCGKYHYDLSAGYGFQVFFNQNMFRSFTDDQSSSSIVPNGDLFLQGLTASARFDF